MDLKGAMRAYLVLSGNKSSEYDIAVGHGSVACSIMREPIVRARTSCAARFYFCNIAHYFSPMSAIILHEL